MGSVLIRAFSLAFIIWIGYFIKKIKLVPEQAGMIARNVMFYITMPAALIVNFSKLEQMSGDMLWVALLGLIGNIVMLLVAVILTRNGEKRDQALYMICLSGYGTGAFTLSLVQNFLPALGNVTVCFFDMGNCLLCSGLTFAITMEYISDHRQGINYKLIGKRVISSAPLLVSTMMTVLLLLGLHLPEFVLTMLEPIAAANPFVSMLMLGLFFHLEIKWFYLRKIAAILILRMMFAVPLALFCYFCLPFELVIRQALVLVSFAPLTVAGPGFVALCGADSGLASAANSLSIVVSLVVTSTLITVLGLA